LITSYKYQIGRTGSSDRLYWQVFGRFIISCTLAEWTSLPFISNQVEWDFDSFDFYFLHKV
jgi:hypothetical protein